MNSFVFHLHTLNVNYEMRYWPHQYNMNWTYHLVQHVVHYFRSLTRLPAQESVTREGLGASHKLQLNKLSISPTTLAKMHASMHFQQAIGLAQHNIELFLVWASSKHAMNVHFYALLWGLQQFYITWQSPKCCLNKKGSPLWHKWQTRINNAPTNDMERHLSTYHVTHKPIPVQNIHHRISFEMKKLSCSALLQKWHGHIWYHRWMHLPTAIPPQLLRQKRWVVEAESCHTYKLSIKREDKSCRGYVHVSIGFPPLYTALKIKWSKLRRRFLPEPPIISPIWIKVPNKNPHQTYYFAYSSVPNVLHHYRIVDQILEEADKVD